MRKVELQKAVSVDKDRARSLGSEHDRLAQSIRWLWYEFTPYEVGCDEIGGKSSTPPLSVATSDGTAHTYGMLQHGSLPGLWAGLS